MHSLAAVIRKIDDLKKTRTETTSTYNIKINEIDKEAREAHAIVKLATSMSGSGNKVAQIAKAKRMIEVQGKVKDYNEVREAIADAISDIASGGRKISRGYFGVKRYDRWPSQRCDCQYGMGPRHGSVWFEIGVTSAYQKEIRDSKEGFMPEEDRGVAIWYLSNLEEFQRLEEEANAEFENAKGALS